MNKLIKKLSLKKKFRFEFQGMPVEVEFIDFGDEPTFGKTLDMMNSKTGQKMTVIKLNKTLEKGAMFRVFVHELTHAALYSSHLRISAQIKTEVEEALCYLNEEIYMKLTELG